MDDLPCGRCDLIHCIVGRLCHGSAHGNTHGRAGGAWSGSCKLLRQSSRLTPSHARTLCCAWYHCQLACMISIRARALPHACGLHEMETLSFLGHKGPRAPWRGGGGGVERGWAWGAVPPAPARPVPWGWGAGVAGGGRRPWAHSGVLVTREEMLVNVVRETEELALEEGVT